jgi:hypothetical protein
VPFGQVSEYKVDVFICKAGDASCKTSEVKEGLEKPKWVVLERDPSDTQVRGVITQPLNMFKCGFTKRSL